MKRFITLAIALMLLLVCGIQIVADDVVVTPNAVCQHEGGKTESGSPKIVGYDYYDSYKHTVLKEQEYICLLCGKVWTETYEDGREPHDVYLYSEYDDVFGQHVKIYQCVECGQQLVYVMEMQTRGRLVEDEHDPSAGIVLRKERGEFHALALAAREGRR